MNKFGITNHATSRYIERHKNNISVNQAYKEILSGLISGSKLKKKTFSKHVLWKFGDNSDIVAVLKNDERTLVCVTILPKIANENTSYFDPENFDFESEFNSLENSIGDYEFSTCFMENLAIYRVALQEEHNKHLQNKQIILERIKIESEERIEKEKIRAEALAKEKVISLNMTNDVMVTNQQIEISELKESLEYCKQEIIHNQKVNSEYKQNIDNLINILISCLGFISTVKAPEVKEIFNQINEYDPTILPMFVAA